MVDVDSIGGPPVKSSEAPFTKVTKKIADIELQFCLDRDTDFHTAAKDLVGRCKTTYITRLYL